VEKKLPAKENTYEGKNDELHIHDTKWPNVTVPT
jgi:hypothetical protein